MLMCKTLNSARRIKNIMKEITLQKIRNRFDLEKSYREMPISRDHLGNYSVKVITRIDYDFIIPKREIDYFITDKEGVIIKSPLGWAKIFNKKVKIIDIKEQYERS